MEIFYLTKITEVQINDTINPRAPNATYMLQEIHMHIAIHILNKILQYVSVGILHIQLDLYTEKKIIIQHYIIVPHE